MSSLDQLKRSVEEHLAAGPGPTKWTVGESALAGRGILATQDISSGEIIFIDHPLIYGPRASFVIERGCTVCCKIDYDTFFKCDKCALLLCSENCLNSEIHLRDCDIISLWKNMVPIDEVDTTVMCKGLAPIRALALNQMQRHLLSSLQANISSRHGSEVQNLKQFFDIPEDEEQLMMLACYVLDANAFEIASKYGKDNMSLRGLYPVSGLMNHSCVPNTRHYFDRKKRMIVKAVKNILAGSEVVSCYEGLMWGTPARRHHLFKTKHFSCTCERCADPTERGTLLSALKCFSRACSGSLIPVEPLKMSSYWRCIECSMNVPPKQVGAIQSALGSLMGTLDFDNPNMLQEFIEKRLAKYIPRTNQIFLELNCRLIWIFGEREGYRWNELSETRLALKETLCRAALRTLAALAAGDAHLRGLLLYHLHAALAERARRQPERYEDLKTEIESSIEQAYKILEGDISAPSDLELRWKYLGPDCDKPTEERFFILDV